MDFGHYWGQIKDNDSNIAVEHVIFCHPGQPYFIATVFSVWGGGSRGAPGSDFLWLICLTLLNEIPFGIVFSFFFFLLAFLPSHSLNLIILP